MDSNKGYLRSQFQAADKTSSGYLLPHEFGELLRQLNIDMTSKEIADVFDEVNTDRTEIEGTVYTKTVRSYCMLSGFLNWFQLVHGLI